MSLTPQAERKLVEDVKVLTGERGLPRDAAVRFRDLEVYSKLSAGLRATTGFLRSDLDGLTGRVTTAEGTMLVHTGQIAALGTRDTALKAADILHAGRLTALEAVDVAFGTRVTAVESFDTSIDGRVTYLESLGHGGGTWGSITGTLSAQTDLATVLSAKAAASHTHLAADISNSSSYGRTLLTSTSVAAQIAALGLATVATTGVYSSLTGIPSTFAPSAHTHAYSTLTGIPSTFAPSAHTHPTTDLTGLGTLATQSGTFSGTHSGSSSGTNTGDQTIAATGDVSGSGTGAITLSIGVHKVTLGMMATLTTGTILGRVTGSTGDVETMTGTQLTTLLNAFTSSLKGLVPPSGGGSTIFLRGDGTWGAGPVGPAGASFPAFSFGAKAANYTATTADFSGNKMIEMDVATANSFTVNSGLTRIEPVAVAQKGAGQTSFVAGAGVTILVAGGALKLRAQNSVASLIPAGTNIYRLSGDITA